MSFRNTKVLKSGHISVPSEDPDDISHSDTTQELDTNVNIPLNGKSGKSRKSHKKRKKRLTFREWIFKNPFRKGKFLFFIAGLLLSIYFTCLYGFEINDAKKTGTILGLIGIPVCITGFWNFRLLMNLTEQIDEFSKKNKLFAKENNELRGQVSRLKQQNDILNTQRNRISNTVLKRKKQNDNLKYLNKKMGDLGVVNVSKLNETLDKAKIIAKKWEEKLIETDRGLVIEVWNNINDRFREIGMTKEIYNKEFLKRLPARYVIRLLNCGTFEYISGGQKVINLSDFAYFLDELADMVSKNQKTKKLNISMAKKRQSQMRINFNDNQYHKRKFTCIGLTKNQLNMKALRTHKQSAYYKNITK